MIIRYIDYPINILLYIKYCFPDLAIFIEEIKVIDDYNKDKDINKIFELADITKKTNIIILNNHIYLVAETLNKLYYIIELLDKYKILCDYAYNDLVNIGDIKYLQNMEQEKFRKI